ncbi:Ent-kaurene synthase [Daldinia sp. FL1419]|nr:Ent-kaurene synthase [Daldinia sp. FL1419]
MDSLAGRARAAIGSLKESLSSPYHGSSSMTMSIYDTAWVAMVSKTEKQGSETVACWMYPQCFQQLLASQSPEGGFGESRAEVDGILNTMAAILALQKLIRNPAALGSIKVLDLEARILRGRTYLQDKLRIWDVCSTIHVGFEILVPTLLDLLANEGINFEFPGFESLMNMNARKLSTFTEEILYSTHQTTLLHSLESFIGKIDFDKISHHLRHGAMMASPSSTAAFLMNASTWNEEAEAYLSFVVDTRDGKVPSAFPITIFEITWVLSTLFESDYTIEDLGEDNIHSIAEFLETQLRDQSGTTGFAPSVLSDADDTAKAILALNLLDRPTACDSMIGAFESKTHFKTYSHESTASFSANCNVLNAILQSADPSRHLPQVNKALGFLCQTWDKGNLSDKWAKLQYSMMLLATVLRRTVEIWDADRLTGLSTDLISQRIPLITLQVLIRTVNSQSSNGSWKDSPEITAYAILTLKKLAPLPWIAETIGAKTRESIDCGVKYLEANEARWNTPEFVWVEKVTYGSKLLSETYCLAALRASSSGNWGEKASRLCTIPTSKISTFTNFFSKLPLFSQEPAWRLRASIVEGYMFAPILRASQSELQIFPGNENGDAKYFGYIPITWTTCNNATGFILSPEILHEMMIIAMLNFQVDKYLEDVSDINRIGGNFESLGIIVHRLFKGAPKRTINGHNGDHENGMANGGSKKRKLLDGSSLRAEYDEDVVYETPGTPCSLEISQDVERVLARFIAYVLGHKKVTTATKDLQRRVRDELLIFVLSHITHSEQSSRLSASNPQDKIQVFTQAQTSYYNWVHTTSADTTSCPYSFEFFRCLIAPLGANPFPGALAEYLGQDLCRHLAVMCRQYNDYGSVERDLAEHSLNSINFPEFHEDSGCNTEKKDGEVPGNSSGGSAHCQSQVQEANLGHALRGLFDIATYERECLEHTVNRLRPEITPKTARELELFVKVTDLHGQIYVVKDINNNAGDK